MSQFAFQYAVQVCVDQFWNSNFKNLDFESSEHP